MLAKQLPSYGTSLETAASDLAHYMDEGYRAVVLAGTEQRAEHLQALLREQGVRTAVDFALHALPEPGKAVIAVGGLSAGLEFPALRFAILTEGERAPAKKPRRAVTNRAKLKSYADLSPGDLVVHEHHGVGRFLEMVKMPVDGIEKDYLKIAYAGGDILYVPATQLDLVNKYIGGGEDAQEKRKLSKLGGGDWERAKSKAKKAVKDLAKGLIQLYASASRATPSPPTRPGCTSLRRSSSTPRPTTSSAASPRSSGTWSSPGPWTGCCAEMWATARPRWPSGPL